MRGEEARKEGKERREILWRTCSVEVLHCLLCLPEHGKGDGSVDKNTVILRRGVQSKCVAGESLRGRERGRDGGREGGNEKESMEEEIRGRKIIEEKVK